MSTLIALGPDDVAELSRLHKACFPLDQVWSPQSFTELLADKGLIGWRLEQNGQNVGFILGRIIFDEAELLTIGVEPQHRRQGLAAELLSHFVAALRQRHVVKTFLEVAENNQQAYKLYTKAGFKLISRRYNYYPGGITAFVLQLDLG